MHSIMVTSGFDLILASGHAAFILKVDDVHICDTDTENPNGQQKNGKQANPQPRINENLTLVCDH